MILHVNHIPPGGPEQGILAERSADIVRTLLGLVADGVIEPRLVPSLRVHLDWIQYKANFREPVLVRRAADRSGGALALAELAVDLRRIEPATLPARRSPGPSAAPRSPPLEEGPAGGVALETWTPVRDSAIWRFNRLFWQRAGDWERDPAAGFEAALPERPIRRQRSGAVADSVADFWTLLLDLEKRGQLPAEVFALEIGVGSGTRAAFWLDRFTRSTRRARPGSIRGSGSSWATIRCPRSTARWARSPRTGTS